MLPDLFTQLWSGCGSDVVPDERGVLYETSQSETIGQIGNIAIAQRVLGSGQNAGPEVHDNVQSPLKQAAAQYQSTVITAYQNVADTLHASLSDADALAADVEAENAAKVTYDLTRRQMESGYVNYLALLSAESAYNQALLNRVQAEATRYGDSVALFQALAGGWWNRTGTLHGGAQRTHLR
jgi:hypothetical protein